MRPCAKSYKGGLDMNQLKKALACLLAFSIIAVLLASCSKTDAEDTAGSSAVSAGNSSVQPAALSDTEQPEGSDGFDLVFTSRDQDQSYDEASATKLALSGDTAAVSGKGASVSDSVITISSEGVYLVTGTLSDGQIIVNAAKTDKIQIVLKDANIHCKTNASIYIKQADKVFLTLADGSENTLTDAQEYTLEQNGDNVDGVIFSKADLTVNGSGSLTITAKYRHGIVSKDDLVVTGGTIAITANGQGLSGRDCVKIMNGTFAITSQGDAIQSDNTEDSSRGFIYICGGSLRINAQADAIQAETLLRIDGGTFDLTTGGGSVNASTDKNGDIRDGWGQWVGTDTSADDTQTKSAKGLKATKQLIINGGTVQIDSSDDSVHCNGDVTILGGALKLTTGDDGVHADSALKISSGTITITKSYEGLEGSSIEISGGTVDLAASDDGINAAGGNDSSSVDGRPGQNSFSADGSVFIKISGGAITIDASGDGIDSNGSLSIEGGKIYVNGPTSGGDGALDYDGEGTISGGEMIAVGSSGMAQGFSNSSKQCSLLFTFSSTVSAGCEVVLKDADGGTVASYTPQKDYQSVVISSGRLEQGKTYTLSAGGQTAEITLDSVAYSNGGGIGGGPGGMQRPGF